MKGFSRALWFVVCALSAAHVGATSSFSYSVPAVDDPSDVIEVSVHLTSDSTDIAAVGCRLTYDDSKVTLIDVNMGVGIPASWSFLFQETDAPGEVDVVLSDQTSAAATMSVPSGAEIVKMTFSRVDSDCAPSTFGFNAGAPDPGAATAAFPENQYVIHVGSTIELESASVTPTSGPALNDHSFLRGNVANRTSHSLDLQDVVDLVSTLFGGFVPSFDCDAAFDVNDDGAQDVSDVVALVQVVFGATSFVLPEPAGAPGVVVPDGGSIPSMLGCAEGEVCP